jgi:hypothetical protein
MMKLKIFKKLGYVIAGLLLFASCEYEFIVPEVVELPDEISFKDDIVPIFNSNCNITGCHVAGHWAVDLTPDNAYQDLFAKNLIDVENPASSLIYTKLTEAGSSHDGRSTPTQQELILKWIEDGALDN